MEKMTDPDRSWLVEFHEEWSQVFGGRNWYTVTPIKLEFEYDEAMGCVEATIILLGIGFRWCWSFTETEMSEQIKRDVERLSQ